MAGARVSGRRWLYATLAGWTILAAPSALAAASCPAADPAARTWLNPRLSAECRARAVLASFKSMDEKLAVLIDGRDTKWLTSRGLPALRGGDGPAGIRGGGVAVTSFPTPLSMAASFDPDTAALYGRTLGAEFFDFGLNQMGGPALDVTRTWHFGRSTESLGEDPFLIATMAGEEVRGIQSRHVQSMAKHFAVYTQEQGRSGDSPLRANPAVDQIVSERAMREIYFPGFKGAVAVGGAGQIMCSFPRINGTYACENPFTLDVLKKEWGFDGLVVPDFPDAQRSIIAAVNAGLDSGAMSSTPFTGPTAGSLATATDNSFNGENLADAVKAGKVSPARIDDMILRRLTPGFRIGTFDHPAKRTGDDVSTPERRAAATDLITRGAVLLKNEGGILPFGPGVKSVAIIGHQAGPEAVAAEMGSGNVAPMHLEAVLPAVRKRAGAVSVSYAAGTLGLDRLPLVPVATVRTPGGDAGFRAEYFANPNLDFSGKPFLARNEAAVANTEVSPTKDFPPNRAWSARWTARFTPVETGVQNFTMAGSGTGRLYVGGKLVGRYDNTDFGDTVYANLPMTAGQPVEVRVEWTPRVTFRQAAVDDYGTTLGPAVRLGWSGPTNLIAEAVEAARKADVAVVFAGHKVGEGMDRLSLALPNDQDALIAAVAAVNPRTVVVLQTGGGVTMPWLDKVAAVMEMWLPGDMFGPAAAKLLFGDAEPGGRLPVTFPRDASQGPAQETAQYPGAPDAKGAVGTARFDEGILVGYRWWDAKGQEPLFPFGHGLSYTRFTLADRGVRRTGRGGATARVGVTNTGARAGAEVVQVYLGFPASAGEPPRQLKGFRKVMLRPGESRTVEVALAPDAFRYWDEGRKGWTAAPGSYDVMVGTSSRAIAYTQHVTPTGR